MRKDDESIMEALRAQAGRLTSVQLADLLDTLTGGRLSEGALVMYFKRAIPAIPLRVLRDAGG